MDRTRSVAGKEPIRLFRSDALEAFTHVTPAVVAGIWVPVALVVLVLAVRARSTDASPWYLPAAVALGLALWTPSEYLLHRFLFHFRPRSPRQERLAFLMHGVHHAQPQVKTRLVMPPAVSIPLAAIFFGGFHVLFGVLLGAGHWVGPVFAGFVAGYVAYDMTHYAIHHARGGGSYFRRIRRHHLHHHGQTPDRRFGVTTTLWDRVFGTLPAEGVRGR